MPSWMRRATSSSTSTCTRSAVRRSMWPIYSAISAAITSKASAISLISSRDSNLKGSSSEARSGEKLRMRSAIAPIGLKTRFWSTRNCTAINTSNAATNGTSTIAETKYTRLRCSDTENSAPASTLPSVPGTALNHASVLPNWLSSTSACKTSSPARARRMLSGISDCTTVP